MQLLVSAMSTRSFLPTGHAWSAHQAGPKIALHFCLFARPHLLRAQ